MPLLLSLLGRFWFVFVIAALLASTAWYREQAQVAQSKLDVFVAETKAAGEKARADAILKESNDAKQIADAMSNRDAALGRLRVVEATRARERSVPLTPAAAQGNSQQCYDSAGLAAAVERYRERVQSIVAEGTVAQIDAQTLLKAWPKP